MDWKFCYLCGGALKASSEHSWQCTNCGQQIYRNPAAAAEAAIVNHKKELLVVTRAKEPYKTMLDLPGGFCDVNETLEDTMVRELKEELGITPDDFHEIAYLANGPNPYPWGKDITYSLAVTFLIKVSNDIVLKPQDDVGSYRWEPLKKLAADHFAFPRQQEYVFPALIKALL